MGEIVPGRIETNVVMFVKIENPKAALRLVIYETLQNFSEISIKYLLKFPVALFVVLS